LKSALMATAHPTADLTVYQQGAGRVDVDRATRQAVAAEPPSVSFGLAPFPHDDNPPITRTVTYANHGADPITLSLAAALAHQGAAAPDGMISVSPATVSVPAGGTADVAVTVDTRLGSDGLYGGDLVATAGDIRIITPLGVEREVPNYNLNVVLVGANGQPSFADMTIDSVGADEIHRVHAFPFLAFGQLNIRLPAGTYEVGAL